MKPKILPTLVAAIALFSSNSYAQTNRAYAITSETKGSYNWNAVREIDLSTGQVVRNLFDKTSSSNFEVVNTDNVNLLSSPEKRSNIKYTPMAEGVAAAALDAKHNRLYYTTMRGTELRYFDLSSSKSKVVYNQAVSLFDGNRYDEANVITRMAIASDGVGYAITNDGNHLIRFTTGQKTAITDLGPLVDGKSNGTVSIHAQCSSWGGDMVGDAYGNLYVVTYRNYIFKVNPQTRTADLVGQVKGLPALFTSNGMAVDDNGEVVLSSAMLADTYYKVNISTLESTPIKNTGGDVFNSSDLANGNLLYNNNAVATTKVTSEVLGNSMVSVYPNPVTSKVFSMQFDKVPAGKYDIILTDASGRDVISRPIIVNALGQVEKISLPRSAAGGMYMIKLTGSNKRLVYNEKIVVQ